jgi:hypothetical protein
VGGSVVGNGRNGFGDAGLFQKLLSGGAVLSAGDTFDPAAAHTLPCSPHPDPATRNFIEMHTVPYGAWNSPITTDLIVGEVVALAEPSVDGGDIYWIEGRPSEKGRSVIVRRTEDGVIRDVLAPPFSCRSRVHEYGGASYVAADGTVWFVNFTDQRIWRLDEDTEPVPVTPEGDTGRRRPAL